MRRTNYDQSSTGTNFELLCFADSDLSRMEFEDNFTLLEHESYRKTSLSFYAGPECRKAPTSLSDCYDLTSLTERQARAYCISSQLDNTKPRDEARAREHLREIIDEKRYKCGGSWTDYLTELLNETSIYEAARDGFPTIPGSVLLFDVLSVQGYSQGDYALVLYATADKFDGMKNHFCNLFYDCPVFCRLEIDGEEIDLMETARDVYEYDRDDIVTRFEATPQATPAAVEFLRENLPESLPYN